MTSTPPRDSTHRRGRRAEEVANWYFRLNGFLQIPGFVLHSDQPRRPITDADVLGVRFPYSQEFLRDIRMTDDRWLSEVTYPGQTLVVIAEVKTSTCNVNGPWTDRDRGGMEKVVRRIGFAPENMTNEIAKSLYETLHWHNDDYRVQYVAVGRQTNHELTRHRPNLRQLTWADVAAFMWERFSSFGEIKGTSTQWPVFGKRFAAAVNQGQITHASEAADFVGLYIQEGRQALRQTP